MNTSPADAGEAKARRSASSLSSRQQKVDRVSRMHAAAADVTRRRRYDDHPALSVGLGQQAKSSSSDSDEKEC
jgi:hypothetical protein